MRNLTLGTIIVVGGLLAAIPFRRDAVHPEASDPDALATGPTSAPFAIATADPLTPPWGTEPSVVGQTASVASQSSAVSWPDHRVSDLPSQGHAAPSPSDAFASTGPDAIPSQQPARPRRNMRVPLTYSDLAVPLSNPHFPDQRFNALSGSPSNPVSQGSVPPVGMAEARVQGVRVQGAHLQGTSPANQSNGSSRSGPESANLASNSGVREESTPAQLASSVPGSQVRPDARQQVLRPPTLDLNSQPASQEPARTRAFQIPEVEMPAMPPAPSVLERQRHWIRQPE
ncbi:MAG: hypothetical protein ACF8AM_21700 [Rhodopirellula sp. JB055]|uniref:hypothetical protein n=1 Tax=Rhodopirellula sp. JB055 TaxID=3342846 RepID=UPI00370C0A85